MRSTALGAALLAGLGVGLFSSPADMAKRWQRDRVFTPQMDGKSRDALYAGWLEAVGRVRSTGKG